MEKESMAIAVEVVVFLAANYLRHSFWIKLLISSSAHTMKIVHVIFFFAVKLDNGIGWGDLVEGRFWNSSQWFLFGVSNLGVQVYGWFDVVKSIKTVKNLTILNRSRSFTAMCCGNGPMLSKNWAKKTTKAVTFWSLVTKIFKEAPKWPFFYCLLFISCRALSAELLNRSVVVAERKLILI